MVEFSPPLLKSTSFYAEASNQKKAEIHLVRLSHVFFFISLVKKWNFQNTLFLPPPNSFISNPTNV